MRDADTTGAWVLVVDDDKTSARHLASAVSSFGHHAEVSHSWTDALARFERRQFDLVLMDAVLPGVDGFRLTQLLRSRARSYVPILFVTGLHETRAKAHGYSAGADDFLTKPVEPVELQVRMTAMLRIRRLTVDLESKRAALERAANLDALTGIANRRQLGPRLRDELERCVRYGHPLSVALADIDHFKQVNDRFGHPVGDEVLRCFGRTLSTHVGDPDAAFRMGGEEFVILCPETDVHGAASLADQVRRAFAAASKTTAAGRCSVSFGVSGSCALGSEATPDRLLATADEAMYTAKRSGRDCVRIYGDANAYHLPTAKAS
ncbi:MAG: diguanylate cyclase [Myxococcales bacterium FL481]|nr:MAG: diguanylate cyclase [Myxococcales bacterium FL481]